MAACLVDEQTLVRPARYAMHDAAEENDVEALRSLLEREYEDLANPDAALDVSLNKNERDNHGCTPLHVAALNASLECFTLLLDKGAKVNLKCNGSPLLHILAAVWAVPRNAAFAVDAAAKLLALPAYDILATDDQGRTWLHATAAAGSAELTRLIADKTPAVVLPLIVAAVDKLDRTALHLAAMYKHADAVSWLLHAGASSAVVDSVGNTPAHAAARAGWAAGVELLTSPPAGASAAAMEQDDADDPERLLEAGRHGVSGAGSNAAAAEPRKPAELRNWSGLLPSEELNIAMGRSARGATGATSTGSSVLAAGAIAAPSTATAAGAAAGVRRGEAAYGAGAAAKTLILTHAQCADHRTCEPLTRRSAAVPPENTARLDTLLSPVNGTLRQGDIAAASSLEHGAPQVGVSEILRVHEYAYVRRLLTSVGSLSAEEDAEGAVAHLDGDTAVSKGSWDAALHAAGAVCAAIDRVVAGEVRNAFCAVRPPGHHAGPRGVVTCENDKDGSHGFCLLNNVAIGAAYARAHYGRGTAAYGAASKAAASTPGAGTADAGMAGAGTAASGAASVAGSAASDSIASGAPVDAGSGSGAASGSVGARGTVRRITIFDFDVHHGNGTEAIIRGLYPSEVVETVPLQFATGAFSTMVYRPWLDASDGADVMFVSSHGYGKRDPASASPFVGWFYPGSGSSEGWNADALESLQASVAAAGADAGASTPAAAPTSSSPSSVAAAPVAPGAGSLGRRVRSASESNAAAADAASGSDGESEGADSGETEYAPLNPHGGVSSITMQPVPVPEPLLERRVQHPHIINVAVPHGQTTRTWRRLMTADVLPRIAAFAPDLILVSAGFDAHHKDSINCGYVGLREEDYEWITTQLMKLANASCGGRIVSVLEGGYRIQGRLVSAFGRSVAAHVRTLASGYAGVWDGEREKAMLLSELAAEKAEQDAAAAAAATAAAAAAAAIATAALQSVASPRVTSSSSGGGGTACSGAGAMLTPADAAVTGATDAATGGDEMGTGRRGSKRKRGGVDYAALDAQMRAEERASKAAKSADGQTAADAIAAAASSAGESRSAAGAGDTGGVGSATAGTVPAGAH